MHTPEFLFEADPGTSGGRCATWASRYPVVLDPDYATWDAYGNRYWPTTYLIDRDGHVRDLHVGEGDEARTEALVRRALAVPAGSPDAAAVTADAAPGHAAITPETYVGAARIQRLAPGQALRPGRAAYRAPATLPPDHVALDGDWTVGAEADQAGRHAALELSFTAKDVYLVLDGAGGRRVGRVLLDGRAPRPRGRARPGPGRAAGRDRPPPLPAAGAPPALPRARPHRARAGHARLLLHVRLRPGSTRAWAVSQKAMTRLTQASMSSGWQVSTTWWMYRVGIETHPAGAPSPPERQLAGVGAAARHHLELVRDAALLGHRDQVVHDRARDDRPAS